MFETLRQVFRGLWFVSRAKVLALAILAAIAFLCLADTAGAKPLVLSDTVTLMDGEPYEAEISFMSDVCDLSSLTVEAHWTFNHTKMEIDRVAGTTDDVSTYKISGTAAGNGLDTLEVLTTCGRAVFYADVEGTNEGTPTGDSATTTELTLPANPSPAGSQLSFTATVQSTDDSTPLSASGTVTFNFGNGINDSCQSTSSSFDAGSATLTVTCLYSYSLAGRQTVTAAYNDSTGTFSDSSASADLDIQPVVAALAPASGPTTGSTEVMLTGKGFTGNSTVSFGSVSAAVVSYVSSTTLKALSPPTNSGAGSVHVTVTEGNITSATSHADAFDYVDVAPALIATQIAVSAATPIRAGDTATYQATVTSGGGNAVESGTVTFRSDNTVVCTVTSPVQPGLWECLDHAITVGAHAITASFDSEDTYAASTTANAFNVDAMAPPTMTAAFNSSSITTAGSATLTLTFTNPHANPLALESLSYAATLSGKNLTLGAGSCAGANLSGNNLVVGPSSTNLGPGDFCTVIVNVPVGQDTGTVKLVSINLEATAGHNLALSGTPASTSVQVIASPTANDKSNVLVSYNTGTSIDLSNNVSDATRVRPATAPAHGALNVNTGNNAAGKTLTYTPAAGYHGADNFTYYAVNDTGDLSSSAATVSITVGDPSLSVSLPVMSAKAGETYSNILQISGGASPYSCILNSGTAPDGVTVNSDCSISGKPASTGAFNFTVLVRDSSSGNTPYTQDSGNLSIAVNCPTNADPPVITSVTAADGQATVSFNAITTDAYHCTQNSSFTVTSSPDDKTGNGASSPITVSGLTNGTAYTFVVTGSNGSTSAPSNSVTPRGGQTISFADPGDQAFGTTPTLMATASSHLAVEFISETQQVCTISTDGKLAFLKAGTCTIDARQPGNAGVTAADQVQRSFAVVASQQTITFNDPGTQVFGTTPTLVATASSSLTVEFTSETQQVCTVTKAGKLNFLKTGLCTIDANQPGNAGVATADQVQRSFSISAAGQTIAFANPGDKAIGTSPVITATASSGLAVSFTSTTAAVCTITPTGTLTPLVAGPCTIAADQPGNANFSAAPQVARTFTITKTDVKAVATTIGGFVSDRAGQIVDNMFDMGSNIDRLNDAAGNSGGSANLTDTGNDTAGLPLPSAMGYATTPHMQNGTLIPVATEPSSPSGMSDLFGLQTMLRNAMQNAGQSGSMDRFSYSGLFDANVDAHNGLAANFRTSLSQIAKFNERLQAQDAATLGIGHSAMPHGFSPFDVWLQGTYAGYGSLRSGQFGLFSIGTDYVFNPDFMLGIFSQIDTMNQTSGTGMTGLGWMAGPYATARLQDNLFWNARAAFGTSNNRLAGTDSLTSTRWLASTSLTGRWKLSEQLTISPDLSFTYFTDTTAAYVNSLGAPIPSVKTELGQIKLSPAITYGFVTDSGFWFEPSLTPELIWNFASTNVDGLGPLSDTATGPQGLRGKIKAGMAIKTPGLVSISIYGSYDGIGMANYSAIAAQAQVNVSLN